MTNSFDSALEFMGGNWAQGGCHNGTLAQTLILGLELKIYWTFEFLSVVSCTFWASRRPDTGTGFVGIEWKWINLSLSKAWTQSTVCTVMNFRLHAADLSDKPCQQSARVSCWSVCGPLSSVVFQCCWRLREKKFKSPETEASKCFKTANLICMQRSADNSQQRRSRAAEQIQDHSSQWVQWKHLSRWSRWQTTAGIK